MKIAISFSSVILGLIVLQGTALASFPDVLSSHPNYDAILHLQSKGTVSGYADGSFHPDQTINRAEFTKIIIVPQLGELDKDVTRCITANVNNESYILSDVDTHSWYSTYICGAISRKLLSGYPDGSFKPAQNINFAEAAKIIANNDSNTFGGHMMQKAIPGEPWYRQYVDFLAENKAIPTSIYSLDQAITRGEMAEIMYRLQVKITNKSSKSYRDFVSEKSSSSQSPIRTYRNETDGYSMEYPNGWKVQENSRLEDASFDAVGTIFSAPSGSDASVFVGVLSQCPAFPALAVAKPNVTIDGKVFIMAYASDGAAGSIGEDTYHFSTNDASRCTVIVSSYFHTTGDAYDEPERSKIKKEITDMQNMLHLIVRSFRTL